MASHTDTAVVTGILERRSGTNYVQKTIGSIYRCKLKLKLISTKQEVITSEEVKPCSPLISPYYQTDQVISVRTAGKMVKVRKDAGDIFFPAATCGAGVYFLLRSKKRKPTKLR